MSARPRVVRRLPGGPRMAGFALLEFSIAALLAVLVALGVADRLAREALDASARASGVWLHEVLDALGAALAQDQAAWAGGDPPRDGQGAPRYTDPQRPSLAELRRAGLLPQGFPERAPLGFGVRLRVAGTGCPGAGCRLDGVATSDRPVSGGRARPLDLVAVAPLLAQLEGHGAWVEPGSGRLLGRAAGVAALAAVAAAREAPGTVLAWTGHAPGAAGAPDPRYVWVHDSRDPQLRGALSVAGPLQAGGPVSAGTYLSPARFAREGSTCRAPLGALASGAQGEVLVCRGAVWHAAEGRSRFGGAYFVSVDHGCSRSQGAQTRNPYTNQCSCPSGYRPLMVANSAGGGWGYICYAP